MLSVGPANVMNLHTKSSKDSPCNWAHGLSWTILEDTVEAVGFDSKVLLAVGFDSKVLLGSTPACSKMLTASLLGLLALEVVGFRPPFFIFK